MVGDVVAVQAIRVCLKIRRRIRIAYAEGMQIRNNLARLKAMKIGGRALDIITLPMPKKIMREGLRLPATYANFYIANTCVLAPTFADPADEVALSVLRECFPNRRVIGIDCRELIWGLGAFHCLTQQQPEA